MIWGKAPVRETLSPQLQWQCWMKSEAVTLGELDLRPITYPHQVHGLEGAVLGLVDFLHLHTLPAHHLLPHVHRVNAVKVHVRKIMRSFSSLPFDLEIPSPQQNFGKIKFPEHYD